MVSVGHFDELSGDTEPVSRPLDASLKDGSGTQVAADGPHVAGFAELGVQSVVLSGGEALMHSNLWSLCELLAAQGVREVNLLGQNVNAYQGPIDGDCADLAAGYARILPE